MRKHVVVLSFNRRVQEGSTRRLNDTTTTFLKLRISLNRLTFGKPFLLYHGQQCRQNVQGKKKHAECSLKERMFS